MKYAVVILCFFCAFTLFWNAQATPMSTATEAHIEESHERVRRDMTGMLDKLFSGGDDNPLAPLFKMAAGAIKSFTAAMGNAKGGA